MKKTALNLAKIVILQGLFIVTCTTFNHGVSAKVSLSIDEPDWQFEFKNKQGQYQHDKVTREERDLLKDLQPLLSNNDYTSVAKRIEQQDVAALSPNLKELYGQVLISNKQYQQAENVLLNALQEQPYLATANRSLSMVYLMTSDLEKARTYLVKSIELGQADAQLYGQLAYINLQTGRPVSAISAYQNALMLEHDNNQWYQGLLFALIESDALPQASNLLEEMLLNQPDNTQLWIQRGQIALKQNNPTRAISSMEAALTLGATKLENLVNLAKLHATEGSLIRASDLLRQHINRFINDKDEGFPTLLSIAKYLSAKQAWDSLTPLLSAVDKQSASLSPTEAAKIKIINAQLALASGQTQYAIDLLKSVITTLPDDGDALLTLAKLLHDNKKTEQAKLFYLRAEALNDYSNAARLGRAQVAVDQRNYAEALTLLRKVSKDNPARTDLLNNIQSLENLLRNVI